MLYNETVNFCLLNSKDKLSNCKLCPDYLCRYNKSYAVSTTKHLSYNTATNDWIFKGSVTLRTPCSSYRDGFTIDEQVDSDYARYTRDRSKFEFVSFSDVIDFLLGSGITYLSLEDAVYFTRIKNEMGRL